MVLYYAGRADDDFASFTRFLNFSLVSYDSSLYDGTTYPSLEEVPKRFAITKRNEWMVEQADVVVAYVKHDWGGAAAMLRYAERKNMRIINISSQKS